MPESWAADSAGILAALARLEAGGSTNGGEGIELAYKVAREHFDREGINRVILATDGDFNVGIKDKKALSNSTRLFVDYVRTWVAENGER